MNIWRKIVNPIKNTFLSIISPNISFLSLAFVLDRAQALNLNELNIDTLKQSSKLWVLLGMGPVVPII